jgi:hypothetical protein
MCAALGAQAFAAPASDDPGSTRGRLAHASKCVMTFGFGGGCDKDQADSRRAEKKAAERPAEVTKASVVTGGDDPNASTRARFAHASKCVMSLGLLGSCDKDAPAEAARRAEAGPAAPDNSTRGRFFQASRCVASFGLVGDCDKK